MFLCCLDMIIIIFMMSGQRNFYFLFIYFFSRRHLEATVETPSPPLVFLTDLFIFPSGIFSLHRLIRVPRNQLTMAQVNPGDKPVIQGLVEYRFSPRWPKMASISYWQPIMQILNTSSSTTPEKWHEFLKII